MSLLLLCLPFIGQLPAIAEINMSIDAKSSQYGWFYATFEFWGFVWSCNGWHSVASSARSLPLGCHVLALVSLWRGFLLRSINVGYFAYFLCWFLLFNPPYDLEHILAGAR
ncbi:MAG: hypothetical protein CM15mP49_34170 [Actinomycetota bacterium]|nr:MAG: hypothetical protein CM15mP49_34170 [Actinomycetota bacterium]